MARKSKKSKKVEKVMHEYKMGELHSGSKHGPMVKSKRQAVAIAMSEANMSKPMKKMMSRTQRSVMKKRK